jgi:hypothetical protein
MTQHLGGRFTLPHLPQWRGLIGQCTYPCPL